MEFCSPYEDRPSTMLQTSLQPPTTRTEIKPEQQSARASSGPVRLLGAGLTTSVLLWLSYFPVAWGFLGWVALAPLLVLVRTEARGRWCYFVAWGSGLAFFIPAISWMRVADPRMYYTWLALSIYCSLYFPA